MTKSNISTKLCETNHKIFNFFIKMADKYGSMYDLHDDSLEESPQEFYEKYGFNFSQTNDTEDDTYSGRIINTQTNINNIQSRLNNSFQTQLESPNITPIATPALPNDDDALSENSFDEELKKQCNQELVEDEENEIYEEDEYNSHIRW